MPSLLDELQSILGRLRYVRSGDIILSEDHNTQNDALYKIKEILENHETRIADLEAGVGAPSPAFPEEPDWSGWVKKIVFGDETIYGYSDGLYAYLIIDEINGYLLLDYNIYSSTEEMKVIDKLFNIHDGTLVIEKILSTTRVVALSPTFTLRGKYMLIFDETPSGYPDIIQVVKNGEIIWEYNVYTDTSYHIARCTISASGKYIACVVAPRFGYENIEHCKVIVFEATT